MKILVPIDGSKNAQKAVRHVAHMVSLEPELEVMLMYVITFEPNSLREETYMEKSSRNEARDALLAAESIIKESLMTANVDRYIARGFSAADQILEFAEMEQYDMIVMGTRGLSNVKRFLIGSVSTRVSQCAPCTVILVK